LSIKRPLRSESRRRKKRRNTTKPKRKKVQRRFNSRKGVPLTSLGNLNSDLLKAASYLQLTILPESQSVYSWSYYQCGDLWLGFPELLHLQLVAIYLGLEGFAFFALLLLLFLKGGYLTFQLLLFLTVEAYQVLV
jgi:hypothetical protein